MSTPTTEIQVTETRSNGGLSLALVIYATITMLAIRWTGYAALPYLVIFAPVLTVAGILVLILVLSIIAIVAGAGSEQ